MTGKFDRIDRMKSDTMPDIQHISPEQHDGFGSNSIVTAIHKNSKPSSLPLFQPGISEIFQKRVISNEALEYLDSYNQSIGKPLSESVKSRLQTGAQLVIAGQQPGLLFGPLYTFWKYLTAVNLAADVSKQTGADLIPAFWIASEDHDIHEVNRFVINGKPFTAKPDYPLTKGHLRPVGMVPLKQYETSIFAFMQKRCRDKPYTQWLLNRLKTCDFSNYSTFFATFAAALFGNMHECIFIDALQLRPLASKVMSNAVRNYPDLDQALKQGADTLRQNGYSPQLYDCGIFEIDHDNNSARVKCRFSNNTMTCSKGVMSLEEAAKFILTDPARFSAGAALRPIVQDSLFPVAITVCGPTEMLYLWQINPLYDISNIERSLLYPRISATVFPASARRQLQKIRDVSRVFQLPETSMSISKQQMNERIFTEDLQHLTALKESLTNQMHSIQDADPLMLNKAVKAIDYHIQKMTDNVLKKRHDLVDSDLKRIRNLNKLAFINGKPQERVMNLCEILVEEGPEWLSRIFEVVSPLETTHRIVSVSSTDIRST